jgi:hypothetical protein
MDLASISHPLCPRIIAKFQVCVETQIHFANRYSARETLHVGLFESRIKDWIIAPMIRSSSPLVLVSVPTHMYRAGTTIHERSRDTGNANTPRKHDS